MKAGSAIAPSIVAPPSMPLAEVIGLCRFSYPALGGFQKQHESPEARARYLYAPERLEERFRSFEAITLPSLRGQTDPDFKLVVVIGENFPQRPRLEALLATLPQATLLAFPSERHRPVMMRAINSVRDTALPFSIQFRIDDDDGVNLSFVARLREVAAQSQALLADRPNVAIDFNRGHVIEPSCAGLRVEEVQRSNWAPGLAVVIRRGNPNTVMNFSHQTVWKTMPTLSIPDPSMFLRGWSRYNDSEFRTGPDFLPLDSEGEAAFRRAYGVEAAKVRALWAEPSAALRQSLG